MDEYSAYIHTHSEDSPDRGKAVVFSMAKVFLWLGIGLLITAVVSIGLPYLLIAMFGSNPEMASSVYMGLIIVSVIMMLPSMIVINVASFRNKSGLITAFYIIYSVSMAVLLSSLILAFVAEEGSYATVAKAFLITSLCFIVMGIVGMVTHKSIGLMWPLLITGMIGCMVISLINFFLGSVMIYWIIDFVMFGIILLVTALDFARVRRIAETGGFESSNALAIYCAFNLYVDYIYIFVRILSYLGMTRRN